MKIFIDTEPPRGRKQEQHPFGDHLFWAVVCYILVELLKPYFM